MKTTYPKVLYEVDSNGSRHRVTIDDKPLGDGAAGYIYKYKESRTNVVKLYKDGVDRRKYKDKILAMLKYPPAIHPIRDSGVEFIQLAWPKSIIETRGREFIGFSMPEIDFSRSVSIERMIQKSMRRTSKLPEAYIHRIFIAANLCLIIEELHALGHYMIDMKPINLRVYPSNMYVAVIDCDGLSISGSTQRFGAEQYSPEYISPEVGQKAPALLGEEQDLFALAVIIFRLMNNGLHPFQGLLSSANSDPGDIQDRINKRLYAYGRSKYSEQMPSPQSIHEYLEDRTRMLFDQAFASARRPTAKEWSQHLTTLIAPNSRLLVKCSKNNEHWHFSKGCGFCALENDKRIKIANAQNNKIVQNPSTAVTRPQTSPKSTTQTSVPQHSIQYPQKGPGIFSAAADFIAGLLKAAIGLIIVVFIIGILLGDGGSQTQTSTNSRPQITSNSGGSGNISTPAVSQQRTADNNDVALAGGQNTIDSSASSGSSNVTPTISISSAQDAPNVIPQDPPNVIAQDTNVPDVVVPAVRVDRQSPLYPSQAYRRRLTGAVILSFVIETTGEVGDVSLVQSSGHEVLDRAAIQHVGSRRYSPQTRNGVPEYSYSQVSISFAQPNP